MMKEYRLSPEERFNERVGRVEGNPLGFETPLGHTYSLVLELLAREGLDATPESQKFLDFIDAGQELGNEGITLETPTFYPSVTRPVIEYMRSKGLSQDQCENIFQDIFGELF